MNDYGAFKISEKSVELNVGIGDKEKLEQAQASDHPDAPSEALQY